MYIFLGILLLYLWVILVIFCLKLSDFLSEYLKSKSESFYYKCWMKRQNIFNKIYMAICDKILDKEVNIFRIKFSPAWAIIDIHLFIFMYLIFEVVWVKIVFMVAKLLPNDFSWLLNGPLKHFWL